MKKIKLDPINEPNRMVSYWKAEKKIVAVIIFTGLFYNGLMEVGPILQGKIIDMLIEGQPKDLIIKWIGIFIAIICAIQYSRYLKRYYVRIFANKTSASMRMMVYNNIINKDVTKLKEETAGDLMNKAISDVGALVEGMRKFTTEIFDTGVLMTAYFITLLFYNWKLTLVSAIFIPIAMFVAERMKVVIYKYSKAYRKQLSKVSEVTLENVDNELLYRVMGVENIKIVAYEEELSKLEKRAVLANMLENSMQPIYKAIAMFGIVVVVFYGGGLVIENTWSVGQFTAYITMFTAFSVKVSKAAKLFNSVQKAQVSWQRIKPYLTTYVKPCKTTKVETVEEVNLEVKDLAFGIIKEANFQVKSGEIIGVTGPVASGKSTIGAALQGLYDYNGSILINGRELKTMKSEEISQFVSYMGHESELLSDTIYNNITLGKDGDIGEVLAQVCFDMDLRDMEKGINTVVGESGVRLSGGQKARIALARALYNKSSVLVLDDPFSAVDVKTEEEIIRNLKEHYSELAIVLISHRVAVFENIDKVVLVNSGRTTFDTHENLMKNSQVYSEIFTLQMEGKDV